MSEDKFTKGEWVKTGQFTVEIGVSGPYTELTTQGTGGVFSCVTEREANAHLIAAAPEMYEMLETAMNILNGDDFESEVSCEDIKKMLAKARGEA